MNFKEVEKMNSLLLNTVHQIADSETKDCKSLCKLLSSEDPEIIISALIEMHKKRISKEKINSSASYRLLEAMKYLLEERPPSETSECCSFLEELIKNPELLSTENVSTRTIVVEMIGKMDKKSTINALVEFRKEVKKIQYPSATEQRILREDLFEETDVPTPSSEDLSRIDAMSINKALLNYSERIGVLRAETNF